MKQRDTIYYAGRVSVHDRKVPMAKNEAKRETVKLQKGKTTTYLFQSDREVTMEEIKDYCEANELEVPEENSTKYWELVSDFRDRDWEDFEENLECSRKLPGQVVITGELGLWDGRHEIIPVLADMAGDPIKFFERFTRNCGSDCEIAIGYGKDGLFVTVSHHDGTNRFRVLEVTDAGKNYLESDGYESDILSDPKFTRKIDYWLY